MKVQLTMHTTLQSDCRHLQTAVTCTCLHVAECSHCKRHICRLKCKLHTFMYFFPLRKCYSWYIYKVFLNLYHSKHESVKIWKFPHRSICCPNTEWTFVSWSYNFIRRQQLKSDIQSNLPFLYEIERNGCMSCGTSMNCVQLTLKCISIIINMKFL